MPAAPADRGIIQPNRPESIAQAIETAIKTKQRRLVIPAGVYRLAPPGHGVVHPGWGDLGHLQRPGRRPSRLPLPAGF